MNLFVEYTKEEIETLLSLFRREYEGIEIFNSMSDYEVKKLCRYLKKEKLPAKKIIEKYDFIWVINGKIIEVENEHGKKIVKKYKNNELIGIDKMEGKMNPLIVYENSEVIFFDINEHSELSSRFYKNVVKYLNKKIT